MPNKDKKSPKEDEPGLIHPTTDQDATKDEGQKAPEDAEKSEPDPLVDDKDTDKAVDDISHKEGDEVLAAEDAELAKAFEPPEKGWKAKLNHWFHVWWDNRRLRWASLVALVVVIIGLFLLPVTRYFLLNTVGVRGSSSLTVLDNDTQLPLKNVSVSLGGQTGLTNTDGKAQLHHVKLGRSQLIIHKTAFATNSSVVTVGWGSNPLGNFTIKAVGSQFTFSVKNWLSGKPIEKAEATSGDANALSDKNGKIVLTTNVTDDSNLSVSISASGYRTEKVSVPVTTKASQAISVSMVQSRKEVFISNRSGKYDLYKIDVDGKNEKLVLAGTGSERDDLSLVPNLTDEEVAYVSTRDNAHNSDGYLLSSLDLIDLNTNKVLNIAQSEQIQVFGWIGSRVIYMQVAAGASAGNPKRYRLISYDYKTTDRQEVAAANSFNDVLLTSDAIYYAPTSSDVNVTGLYRSSPDGHTKRTLLSQQIWNILRVDYGDLNFLTQSSDWYSYKFTDTLPIKMSADPANPKNHLYMDNSSGDHSLWVDQRDGKGTLLDYNVNSKQDKTLVTQSGLNYPLRWLTDDTVIYRIHTDQETADYVLSTAGGTAHKIRDVVNSNGQTLWYYY